MIPPSINFSYHKYHHDDDMDDCVQKSVDDCVRNNAENLEDGDTNEEEEL